VTNLERWQFYCKDLSSPDSFIEWSFLFTIAASLQRRVWTGDMAHMPLFPNLYVFLVGEPATGKGLVIKPTKELLCFHKEGASDAQKAIHTKKGQEPPNLIYVGPDSTTYEKLVNIMSHSIRAYWHEKEGKQQAYTHSSACLTLEEASSLFRKNTDNLVKLLLSTYDCGTYTYDTIGRGEEKIHKCCLNLLAGTTPGFIRTIFADELIDEGFSSRTIFVYEMGPRHFNMFPPKFSTEQVEARNDILAHIKKLTSLYGEIQFTPEAREFMTHWWKTDAQTKRANPSLKLSPYYGRKNITTIKTAIAIHFSDRTSLDEPISLDTCLDAIKRLERVEKKMHFSLVTEKANPLAKATDNILKYIRYYKEEGRGLTDIKFEFWEDLPQGESSLREILTYLISIGKIKSESNKYVAL
jgi:hypothetical protein